MTVVNQVMPPLRRRMAVVQVVLLAALGQISAVFYAPAIPMIVDAIHASASQIELATAGYFASFASAQLVFGPLSDRWGRRPILMSGLVFYLFAMGAIFFVQSAGSFFVAQVVAGVGGSICLVVGRAVLRDLFSAADYGRVTGAVGTAVTALPSIAPILGGYLADRYGWRSQFAALFAYGALLLVFIVSALPETAPVVPTRTESRPFHIYRALTTNREFLLPTLASAWATAIIFTMVVGRPAFLFFHGVLDAISIGVFASLGGACIVLGNAVSVPLFRRYTMTRVLYLGFVASVCGGIFASAWATGLRFSTIPAIIAMTILVLSGLGILLPAAVAMAMKDQRQFAGSAAALFGAIQLAGAACGSAAVAWLARSFGPDAMLTLVGIEECGLTLLVVLVARRRPAT
jgi:MFS transporter, DHA1 family, multidrug resistance protein